MLFVSLKISCKYEYYDNYLFVQFGDGGSSSVFIINFEKISRMFSALIACS